MNQTFTDEEWTLLRRLPAQVGQTMVQATDSGLTTITQQWADRQMIAEAAYLYPENMLISELLASDLPEAAPADEPTLLEECRHVALILAQKASADVAADYKQWLLLIAYKVAYEGREGGFFGIGGQHISPPEQSLLARIADALGAEFDATHIPR